MRWQNAKTAKLINFYGNLGNPRRKKQKIDIGNEYLEFIVSTIYTS